MQRVLVTSFTESARKSDQSTRGPANTAIILRSHRYRIWWKHVTLETVYPWPWTRAHQWSRYQSAGPGAPTGPSSWATVTSMEVHEACTTQASPPGLLRMQRRKGTRLYPSMMFAVVVPHHSTLSSQGCHFLYVVRFSCTCYFPKELAWGPGDWVQEPPDSAAHPAWHPAPRTQPPAPSGEKAVLLLTQSEAHLCLSAIISHSVFQGKVWLCEMQDDLMKWNQSKPNPAK